MELFLKMHVILVQRSFWSSVCCSNFSIYLAEVSTEFYFRIIFPNNVAALFFRSDETEDIFKLTPVAPSEILKGKIIQGGAFYSKVYVKDVFFSKEFFPEPCSFLCVQTTTRFENKGFTIQFFGNFFLLKNQRQMFFSRIVFLENNSD